MKLTNRVSNIQESATLAITAKANKMRADGLDVISFSAGEPDFQTPSNIQDAGIRAIREGKTRYTAAWGIPELKNAIVDKLRNENSLQYEPDEIIVCSGAKQALFNVILALCEAGDEVIVPAPYWVSYPEMIRAAEATPVYVGMSEANSFKLTPEDLRKTITPKTRAVLLNSPGNPTGAVYTESELKAIGEVLAGTEVVCISDEIYEHLVYGGQKFVSFARACPGLRDQTVIINGVSKSYAMTGWRIGYAVGPKSLISATKRLQAHSTSCPCTIAQWATVEALTGDQSAVSVMVSEFDKRRKRMVQLLNDIPGIKCSEPMGAFYVFPNVTSFYGKKIAGITVNNSEDFVTVCLEKARIALVQGSAFGGDDFVRLSYATSMQDIENGLERLRNLLSG